MAIKYCAAKACGAKTETVGTIPKFCSTCGEPFSKAFGTVTPVVRTATPREEEIEVPVVRKTTSLVSKRAGMIQRDSGRPQRPPTHGDGDGGDDMNDGYFSRDEIKARAQELVDEIGGDFITVHVDKGKTRLKDVMDRPDDFSHLGQRTADLSTGAAE